MKRCICALAAIALPLGAILAQSNGTEAVKPSTAESARSQQSSQESVSPPPTAGASVAPITTGTVQQSGTDVQTSGTDSIIPVPHMSK